MMKFVFYLIFMVIMLIWNNYISFYYNLMFFVCMMLLMSMGFNYDLSLNMSLYLSLDCFSFMLLLMSMWIMGLMLMILKSKDLLLKKMVFMMMMLILMVFFSLKNMFLFYFFFELSLIPTFMLIIYWGYNLERLSAAYFMLLYTFSISLPLLVYIFYFYKSFNSFDFFLMKFNKFELGVWGMMVILGAFMVKMPVYLFHIWLPKAHVEAPVYGSMILAAVLLKLGGYGLMRILLIFIEMGMKVNIYIMSVALIGSMVISLVSLVQIDMKSLVAYSSVVHMNIMLCGLMSFFKMGHMSAYIIMISHGLCSSGLFYMVNMYYYRTSSRLLIFNKGMINILPSVTIWWFLMCCANFSFPLSFSFIGEIYILMVLVSWSVGMLIYLILINFFSSIYSLFLYLYVQHGELMYMNNFNSGILMENFIMIMHFFPLMLILVSMNMF